MSKEQSGAHKTSIGGQALIEGVMMKGPSVTAMAVRNPKGEIVTSEWQTHKGGKPWHKKTPFVRGAFEFVSMMMLGYKCLMKSADMAEIELDDESKLDRWIKNKFGDKATDIITYIALIMAIGLAVGLFFVLPTFITGFFQSIIPNETVLSFVETTVKITLFVLYLVAISRLEDIRRVFMYHGAEHKTIFCYERGMELTVENVRDCPRFHPRCGTSFLLIVMVVSAVTFSFLGWGSLLLRTVLKVLLLPVVVGISYEIIKFAGRHDNILTRAISAPGMWLQALTTAEPDDSMIEVAIAAMTPCIPSDKTEDRW